MTHPSASSQTFSSQTVASPAIGGPPRGGSASSDHGRAGPGTLIGGRYTLRTAIGHGGMGTVWRGTDTLLRRDVAVKEVAPPAGVSPADRDSMYERMMREARAAAVISHPSVVQVYDVVTEGGRPWIVMELLDARSLADMVMEDGPLAPRVVAKIGVAMLGALEMAHAAGVLHRDVKPANVLICTDGRPVLTDFGVARMPTDQQLTTPGMVLGSPHFISPERAMGAKFGPPSDLFSLGVTLYAAVEGRPPFDKGDPILTMHSVVEDAPRPPERSGVLTEVLFGLMDKDPSRRWDAARARQTLRELLSGPLASQTPHFPTDPYSVVPTQRPVYPAAPTPTTAPTSQIGGRALLPPDATAGVHPGSGGGAYAGAGAATGAGAQPESRGDAWVTSRVGARPDPGPTSPGMPVVNDPRGATRTGRRQRRESAVAQSPLAQLTATAGRLAGEVRDRFRQLPRNAQLASAAGLVAVLVLGTVLLVNRGGGEDPGLSAGGQSPVTEPTAGPGDSLLAVQEFADRGLVVNLPADWQETDRSPIRVDFADPADGNARLRLLVEDSGADAERFIEIIEPIIKDNCPEPYQRVELSPVEIAGEPAAQLEYTCGSGDEARHAKWATVVRDGKAYSFFLTVPPTQFADRQVIFEEMVRSFRFA